MEIRKVMGVSVRSIQWFDTNVCIPMPRRHVQTSVSSEPLATHCYLAEFLNLTLDLVLAAAGIQMSKPFHEWPGAMTPGHARVPAQGARPP